MKTLLIYFYWLTYAQNAFAFFPFLQVILFLCFCGKENENKKIYIYGKTICARIRRNSSLHNIVHININFVLLFFLRWLITPFRDNGHLPNNQRKFNKILSSIRQVVERAIGLLKGRWRKLLDIDHLDVRFAAKLIMAACVMHNFCLIYNDFDNSYFLPNDGDDEDEGSDDGRAPRNAQLKRNRLMNIVCH